LGRAHGATARHTRTFNAPVKSHLLTLASSLSGVLCASLMVLWVVSYREVVYVGHTNREGAYFRAASHRGGIEVNLYRVVFLPGARHGWEVETFPADGRFTKQDNDGRGVGWRGVRLLPEAVGRRHVHALVVSHWLVAIPLAVPPGWWLKRRARDRDRKRKGRCHQCGYDLRATPDRCPECGRVPAGGGGVCVMLH
jgi:hypothetical protein